MQADVIRLHTHWRLIFESDPFFSLEPEFQEVWVDAWQGTRPVSINEAIARAMHERPRLQQSVLAAATRVRH